MHKRSLLILTLLPSMTGCLMLDPGPQNTDAGPPPVEEDGGMWTGPPDSGMCPTDAACAFEGTRVLEVASLTTLPLDAISPASGVDFVELRVEGSTRSSYGIACAGATDAPACAAALAAIEPEGGFGNACGLPSMCPASLVVTRGDEVLAITTREGVLEVLGAIDAPVEAALLVFASPSPSPLPYVGFQVSAVVESSGGYRVLAQYLESDCTPVMSRGAVLEIAPDGALTSACDSRISCLAGACI